MLIVTHQQAKWDTHRPHDNSKANHKGQKVGGGLISGNLHPFPKLLEYSAHSLAYEITHPYKNWQPHRLVSLPPSEMAHTLSVEYVSL